jgi:hypothetical protein
MSDDTSVGDSMPGSTVKNQVKQDSGFFQPYSEFAKILRTWYIAYGAGALALLLTNDSIREALKEAGHLYDVALALLLGVAVQVVYALLYKHAMWHLFCAELDESHRDSLWFKASDLLSESHAFELTGDLVTAGCFIWATVLLFAGYS